MSLVNDIMRREEELRKQGIPLPEIQRTLIAEFETLGTPVNDWPPELTGGLDIVDRIYPDLILDSGYPPEKPYEPYLSEPAPFHPDNQPPAPNNPENYAATGAQQNSEPSMHNEEGWHGEHLGVNPDLEQTNSDPNSVIYDTLLQEGIADQDTKLDVENNRTEYLHPDGEIPHEKTSDEIHIHLDLPTNTRSFEFEEPKSDWEPVIQEASFRAFTHSSSFVGNVLYDEESNHMQLILNGKTYDFCGVRS